MTAFPDTTEASQIDGGGTGKGGALWRSRSILGVAIACLCLIVSACGSGDPTAEATTPQGESSTGGQPAVPEECPYTVTGYEVECGELTVPENYDEPGAATVVLPYVVLPATGGDRSAEPLVYLQGGPGVSTMVDLDRFATSELRRERDIILLEQRGTGVSEPFLGCEGDSEDPDQLQKCYDGLVADGVDPSQYTTLNAAKDLAELRRKMEIDRWHLLGISYGTTLAMVAMDNDPDGIASVILDSPTAPNVVIMNADIESLLDVTGQVLADCSNDSECSSRYPGDLFEQHIANFQTLKGEPWTLGDDWFSPSVGHEAYLDIGFAIMDFSPATLPAFVSAVANRDADALLALDVLEEGESDGAASVLIAKCEADAECSRLEPDLRTTHEANLDGLAKEPWTVEDPALIDLFFEASVGPDSYEGVSGEVAAKSGEALPGFVAAVAARDEEALLAVQRTLGWDDESFDEPDGDSELPSDGEPSVESVEPPDSDGDEPPQVEGLPENRVEAFGYTLSVYCSEDAPYFDLETNPFDTADEWPSEVPGRLLPPFDDWCGVWKVDPADPGDVDQVNSDIPTLILAGQLDHLTPLRQGEIAAVGLSESELLEVPSTGHGTIDNACVRSIMVDFLRAPGGDRSCLTEIAPIEWR